jgi:AcrR family transcriptional regulator
VESARILFYARGVNATGVEDIAGQAGRSKPTLYRHFHTKEALVSAYLDDRKAQLDAELRSWIESVLPRQRPRGVIEWLCDWLTRPEFKGCAFVRTYAELIGDQGVRARARERKHALLMTIREACQGAGVDDPRALAEQLLVIVEGATTIAFVSGNSTQAADSARSLARVALDAAGLVE